MKVNEKQLDLFDVQGIQLPWAGIMGINNNIFTPDSSYHPVLGIQQLFAQERELIVDFDTENGMSDFTSEISKDFILDVGDGYEYKCFLNGNPSVEQESMCSFVVKYPVLVIKRKPLITKEVTNSINVLGNVATEARLKITSEKFIDRLSVNNIIITNMKAETLVIDGLNKLVYYDASNDSAFDDVELNEFPKFTPGINVITKSDESVKITVEYYPTYM